MKDETKQMIKKVMESQIRVLEAQIKVLKKQLELIG